MKVIDDITRTEYAIKKFKATLNNPTFLQKAPPQIIEKEKEKLRDFSLNLKYLYAQKRKLIENIQTEVQLKFGSANYVQWLIEEERDMIRFKENVIEKYSEMWFQVIYAPATDNEILYLGEKLGII